MPDGRILIADDEDSLRWVLEKGLKQAGYRVVAVKDGEAALQEAGSEPFDLILLDIRMPGMDGLTLLGKIREARPDAQEVTHLKTGLQEVWEFGALVGRHPRMQEVYKTIGRVAASDVTVLLRGESGAGQEVG